METKNACVKNKAWTFVAAKCGAMLFPTFWTERTFRNACGCRVRSYVVSNFLARAHLPKCVRLPGAELCCAIGGRGSSTQNYIKCCTWWIAFQCSIGDDFANVRLAFVHEMHLCAPQGIGQRQKRAHAVPLHRRGGGSTTRRRARSWCLSVWLVSLPTSLRLR